MKSLKPGKSTSKASVLNISEHGLWLLIQDKEFFLSFKNFPWFLEAKIAEVYNVRLEHNKHLCWPDLDVDLDIRSLERPEEYPLTYQE